MPLHVSRAALVLVALALPPLLAACSFQPGSIETCEEFFGAPLQPKTGETEETVVEDGTVAVYHGSACARNGSGQRFVRVTGRKALPRWATAATVFHNGWVVRYLGNDDHHVRALGSAISGITLRDTTLFWQATGALTDDSGSARGIDWCYQYTVVGWDPSKLDVVVDHKDGQCAGNAGGAANFFYAVNDRTSTALASFPTFIQNRRFTAGPIAVLPRGFAAGWLDGDHHVKQLSYVMDHSEVVTDGPFSATSTSGRSYWKSYAQVDTAPPGQEFLGATYVSWETRAILKDDDFRRGFQFAEIASALAGRDVGLVRPPFSVLPQASQGLGLFGSCVSSASDTRPRTEHHVVDDVPFEYAIPMLTGWDVAYDCTDHHVIEAGAFIPTFKYTRAPGVPGQLSYDFSYVLVDSSKNGYSGRHGVTILGLKRLASAGRPR